MTLIRYCVPLLLVGTIRSIKSILTEKLPGRHIRAPEDAFPLGQRPIRYSDLDGNRHVNNAVYGDILCDFLPGDWQRSHFLRSAVLLYEHEARLGDTLQITGCQIGPDSWYLAGYRSGQRCFAAQAAFDRA